MLSVKYKATYGENITLSGTCGNQSEAWEIRGLGSDFVKIQLKVSVNGSDTNPGFRIYSNIDNIHNKWAIITEKGNNIDILLTQNKSTEDRTCTLIVYNLFNSDEYVAFDFVQKGESYECDVKEGSELRTNINNEVLSGVCSYADNVLTLKENIINKENKPWGYSDVIFELNVSGGSGEAVITSIKQYDVVTKNNKSIDTSMSFDKGIVCKLLQNERQIKSYNTIEGVDLALTHTVDDDKEELSKYLVIRHYGRVFVDETNYYIITLAHKDCRNKKLEIKVNYNRPSVSLTLLQTIDANTNTQTLSFNATTNTTQQLFVMFNSAIDYGYKVEWVKVADEEDFTCQVERKTYIYSDVFFDINGKIYKIDGNKVCWGNGENEHYVIQSDNSFSLNGKKYTIHTNHSNQYDYVFCIDNIKWCDVNEYTDRIVVIAKPNYDNQRSGTIRVSQRDNDNVNRTVVISQTGVDNSVVVDAPVSISSAECKNVIVTAIFKGVDRMSGRFIGSSDVKEILEFNFEICEGFNRLTLILDIEASTNNKSELKFKCGDVEYPYFIERTTNTNTNTNTFDVSFDGEFNARTVYYNCFGNNNICWMGDDKEQQSTIDDDKKFTLNYDNISVEYQIKGIVTWEGEEITEETNELDFGDTTNITLNNEYEYQVKLDGDVSSPIIRIMYNDTISTPDSVKNEVKLHGTTYKVGFIDNKVTFTYKKDETAAIDTDGNFEYNGTQYHHGVTRKYTISGDKILEGGTERATFSDNSINVKGSLISYKVEGRNILDDNVVLSEIKNVGGVDSFEFINPLQLNKVGTDTNYNIKSNNGTCVLNGKTITIKYYITNTEDGITYRYPINYSDKYGLFFYNTFSITDFTTYKIRNKNNTILIGNNIINGSSGNFGIDSNKRTITISDKAKISTNAASSSEITKDITNNRVSLVLDDTFDGAIGIRSTSSWCIALLRHEYINNKSDYYIDFSKTQNNPFPQIRECNIILYDMNDMDNSNSKITLMIKQHPSLYDYRTDSYVSRLEITKKTTTS